MTIKMRTTKKTKSPDFMKMNSNRTRVTLAIPQDLWIALKKEGAVQGQSANAWLNRLLSLRFRDGAEKIG